MRLSSEFSHDFRNSQRRTCFQTENRLPSFYLSWRISRRDDAARRIFGWMDMRIGSAQKRYLRLWVVLTITVASQLTNFAKLTRMVLSFRFQSLILMRVSLVRRNAVSQHMSLRADQLTKPAGILLNKNTKHHHPDLFQQTLFHHFLAFADFCFALFAKSASVV